jgi:hypothetical protein
MQRFTHASHQTKVNFWLWLALVFTSCEDSFMKQATANKMGAVANLQTTIDSDGNFVAQIDPTKSETQLMRITEGAIAGAAVAIPPSALSIPVSIMVGEGVALTTNSFSKDLGLTGNTITAGGPSVSFTASQDVVASNPLTLSIPFGALAFALADVDTENLVVIYRWMTLKDGQPSYEVGVIPGDKVTRGQNKVSFQTTKFGTFQVGISETKISRPLLAATEEPPALKSCERYAAAAFPTCTQDGQVGCLTTENFKAVDMNLAKSEFILAGKTMASITGNVTLPDPGKVLTNTSYGAGGLEKSGTLTLPDPSKVLASSASYGNPSSPTTPTLTDRGVWDLGTSFAGAGYYSGVSNMPTASSLATGTNLLGFGVMSTTPTCSEDGESGCRVIGPNFAAAEVSTISADRILHPTKIGGITGSVHLPSAADVKHGVRFGAGSTLTGSLITGATVTQCTSTNQTDCITNPEFPSVQKSSIVENASKFLNDLNIAGVTGSLSACSAEVPSDCYLPAFDAANQPFKAFSSLPNLGPWDIRHGKNIMGITGELKSTCRNRSHTQATQTINGQIISYAPITIQSYNHGLNNGDKINVNFSANISELPSGNYYAIRVDDDTIQLSYNAEPSLAKVTLPTPSTGMGYQNVSTTITSTTNTTTTDDWNNPLFVVWGNGNDCGGVDSPDIANDNHSVWRDVTTADGTTPSTCMVSPGNCTMQDKISGLWWSKSQSSVPWSAARTNCESLNTTIYSGSPLLGFNGKTGWRLPTQKELMEAYTHGIRSVPSGLGGTNMWISESMLTSNSFWSGSTVSWNPTYPESWAVNLAKGSVSSQMQTQTAAVVCVR